MLFIIVPIPQPVPVLGEWIVIQRRVDAGMSMLQGLDTQMATSGWVWMPCMP